METLQVPLRNRHGAIVGHALIDAVDYGLVEGRSFHLDRDGYAATKEGKRPHHRKTVGMHRIIMGAPSGTQVDHINHDKLDNRRANLRLCTIAENVRHRSPRSKSGVLGVYSYRDRWVASIKVQGRSIHLGYFDSLDDAALARDRASKQYFGDFAYLNAA